MTIKVQGTNVEATHPLFKPLRKWIELMDDPTWLGNDCPWWYNERASISLFAGAVWLAGGWVLEEFSATKQTADNMNFKGRVDLMFWTDRRRGEGSQFVAEVKPCWPRLRSSDAIQIIKYALNRAADDVQKNRAYDSVFTKLAMVFAAPVIPSKYSSQISNKVNELVVNLKAESNLSLAWYFRTTGEMPQHNNYFYPGVILGMYPVDA